jgi:hypothetical protein
LSEGDAIFAFRIAADNTAARTDRDGDIDKWMDSMRDRVRPGDVVIRWDAWIVAALENVSRADARDIVQRLEQVLPRAALQEVRATITPTRLSAEELERIRPSTMQPV